MNKAKTAMKDDLPVDTAVTIKGALVLRALNNSFRQNIINLIHAKKRINVTDIYKKLRLEQSATSQHLAVLRNQNFVITEGAGKEIYYSLNYQRFKDVDKLVKGILKKEHA